MICVITAIGCLAASVFLMACVLAWVSVRTRNTGRAGGFVDTVRKGLQAGSVVSLSDEQIAAVEEKERMERMFADQ